MKTNSLFKRLVSMLIVVLMICTLFPVTALAEDGVPNKPTDTRVKWLLSVNIHCNTVNHDRRYSLRDSTFTTSYVTQNGDGEYICTVTVNSGVYISLYSDLIFGTGIHHNLATNEDPSKTVTLVYKYVDVPILGKQGQWCLESGDDHKVIEFKVVCEDTPSAPTLTELNDLLEVEIDCETDNRNHPEEKYYPLSNKTAIGTPYTNESGTFCIVTVHSGDDYIERFSNESDINKPHQLDDDEKADKQVLLEYKNSTWSIYSKNPDLEKESHDGKRVVEFDVKCVDTPAKPSKPEGSVVESLLTSAVKIHCSVKTIHDDATYGLLEGSYQIGEVTGNATEGYECTVTVNSAKYIEEYNKTNAGHKAVATDLPSRTITLKYTDGAWTVKSGSAPVVFCVECESPAPAPKQPVATDLPQILWSEAVKIHCSVKTSHADATYGLLEGSYDIGDVTEKDGVYICEITVYPTLYVNTYNEYTGVIHKLDPDNQVSATITLIYVDNYGWDVARAERSTAPAFTGVTFNVVCEETPVTTYTVTYKDGVGGKVFKDDVHTVKSGATTPAFVGGIPTRPGYVFVGWTPAVSGTVKGNATYTATWRKVKDTTVIEIGGGNSSSSSSKEENPNTGAPVFVGVSVGALAAAK